MWAKSASLLKFERDYPHRIQTEYTEFQSNFERLGEFPRNRSDEFRKKRDGETRGSGQWMHL